MATLISCTELIRASSDAHRNWKERPGFGVFGGDGYALKEQMAASSCPYLFCFDWIMSTTTLWYYHKEGRGFGPVEEAHIRGLLASSEIAADTLVWRDGLSNWTEAQNTELGGLLSEVPSVPPRVLIVPPSRRKHSKVSWFVFVLAELFNCLIFGVIPLFVALALGVSH